MDFTDLQMTLTVVVILTAAAVVVFFDHRRKHRPQPQPQHVKSHIHSISRPRPIKIYESSPLEYAPAKKLAAERPLEPLVGTATSSRPAVQMRERESVTVQMASPSPSTPSSPAETQPELAAERPQEPLVGTTTSSRPPVQMRERETVTVQMASPSPAASSSAKETGSQSEEVALPAFTIDAVLWERLISSQPQRNLLTSMEGEPEPDDKTPAPPTLGSNNTVEASYQMIQNDEREIVASKLPSGMIQKPVLEQLLESGESFTGLVVSIGINDSDSSMWHSQGLMQSVGNYIAGLLRTKDFSCRTGYDEFVMVCQGEEGAQSQRRLNHISERLWDYQLRGIGACAILFSWGGVQVQNQPLAEAVASATERMRETKRSGSSAHGTVAHRQAV
jgi:hypothetical protein